MVKESKAGLLNVNIYPSRSYMGNEAAELAAEKVRMLLNKNSEINIIFAAAPSQNEFIKALKLKANIEWNRINVFHMDEYIGLDKDASQGFGNFLKAGIFRDLPFKTVNYINGQATDPESECQRYSSLLKQHPADIIFMGIGENGHLAFNDPPVADFEDPKLVKIVELDKVCRQQQVNDGCFKNLSDVPSQAITLTLPCLMSASYIFCMVPGKTKANAVSDTINKPIITQYPSTILRTHLNAILFLDSQSSALLEEYAA